MSGEFGVRMREVMDLEYSTAKEMCFLNYFSDAILALYEAAHRQRNHGSGLPCEQVKDLYAALDSIDAQAKGKL